MTKGTYGGTGKSKARIYAETAWELGKDAVALGVDAAATVTPLVPREIAEWACDRTNYDTDTAGIINCLVEGVGGSLAFVLAEPLSGGDPGLRTAIALGGLYAAIEARVRAEFKRYTSTLPVTVLSHAAQGIFNAGRNLAEHVSDRYSEVIRRNSNSE